MKRCLQCEARFEGKDWRCPVCKYAPANAGNYPIFAPDLLENNDNYAEDFFPNLAQLEKGHFWFEARNKLLLWATRRYFPECTKLFEVGCGTGFVLQQFKADLPGVELYASDILVNGLHFAAQRVPSAELIQMDACDIPYLEEFDLIGAFDVIEHIDKDELALAQMYNALKPGGGIIISVPQHQFLWSVIDDLSYHKRRYERGDLINKVERAGFQIVKTTSFVALLLPAMLLTRSGKAQAGEEVDFYAEFKLNPVLNALLLQVMRIEVALIRLGLTFCLGGSRLLVARRPV